MDSQYAQVASREYDIITADLHMAVDQEHIESPAGEALLRYFYTRVTSYLQEKLAAEARRAGASSAGHRTGSDPC